MKSEIYIQLVNEGTEVWRPTKGLKLEGDLYKILKTNNYNSEDENWEFKPGSIVKCKFRIISGSKCLVAIERVD